MSLRNGDWTQRWVYWVDINGFNQSMVWRTAMSIQKWKKKLPPFPLVLEFQQPKDVQGLETSSWQEGIWALTPWLDPDLGIEQ